jgi:ketosteroid isomerase-like protein
VVFLSLLLVVTMAQATVTATNVADQTPFRRLEAEWNDAHMRGDASLLNRLYGDDVVIVVPGMRVMTKSDALGMLQPGRMTFERYDTSELQIRVYDQMAIVTGRLRRTRVIADKKAEDDWRFTKVYARRASGWQVVSFHASNTATQ